MDGNNFLALPVNGHLHRGTFPPEQPEPAASTGGGPRTARELWLRYVHLAAIGTEYYQHLEPITRLRFEAEIAGGGWFGAVADLRREALRLKLPLSEQFLADPTPSLVAPGWGPTQEIRCRLVELGGELPPLFARSSVNSWLLRFGEHIDEAERHARHAAAVAEGMHWRLRHAAETSARVTSPSSVGGGEPPPHALPRTPPDSPRENSSPCPVRVIEDAGACEYRVLVVGVEGAQPGGVPITLAMYAVLTALSEAYPRGLSSAELTDESGVLDPGKAIREAMLREPALSEVLQTPKRARRNVPGLYRIRSARTRTVQPEPRA